MEIAGYAALLLTGISLCLIGGGYRSMIFTSVLKARGFENFIDSKGGFNAIKKPVAFQVPIKFAQLH